MRSTSVALLFVATNFLISASSSTAGASERGSPQRGDGPPEAQAAGPEWYVNHYANGHSAKIHNVSDGLEWRRDFMGRYAEAYELYQKSAERIQREFANITQHARDCHTFRALDEWRDAQRARIKAFVPKTFRHFADASLDREFEANKARIEQEQAAAKGSNSSNATEPQVLASAPDSSAQRLMDQYANQWIPHPVVSGSSDPPEWYINHYAGERVPAIKNVSDAREWRRNFMNRYVEAYKLYAEEARRIHREFADAPQDISNCNTLEELKRWRHARRAEIKAFVPQTFQQFALDSVEREFETNKARSARHRVGDSSSDASAVQLAAGILESSPQHFADGYAEQWMPRPLPDADTPPEWYINHYAGSQVHNVSDGTEWQNRYAKAYQLYSEETQHLQREFANAPRHAGDCHTLRALREWRDYRRARIEAFVPRAFQKRAEDDVDEDFDSNKARIVQEEAREDASNTSRSASNPVATLHAAQLMVGVPEADQERMSWQEQWIPHPLPDADTPPEWYVNHNAGKWVPTVHNVSDWHEWMGSFADRYAQAYQHYVEDSQRLQREFDHAPQHAREAQNLSALRDWRHAQRAQIEAFVPRTFQQIAEGNVDQEFEANKARIEREEARRQSRNGNQTVVAAGNASAATGSPDVQLLVGFPGAQNDMGWGEQWMRRPLPNPSTPEQYINHYAGKWVRSPDDVTNASEWGANFVDGYAQAYRNYFDDAERLLHEFGNATQHARDCHTLAELREWRDAQRAQIEAFVPQTFQRIAKDAVEQQFARNKARILRGQHTGNVSASNESAELQLAEAYQQYAEESERIRREFAHAPRHARDCHNLTVLREWRDAQRAKIEAFVPQTFQRMAERDVDKAFEANELRIAREEAAERATANTTAAHDNHSGTADVSLLSGAEATQNLMGWYEPVQHPLPDASTPPEWYVNHFAGQWIPKIHNATNGTQWREHLVGRYNEAYRLYTEDARRIMREFADSPQHARDCHTLPALRKWRDAQRARIQAFVPRAFQRTAKDEVDAKFERNKARVAREEAVQRRPNVSASNESAGMQLFVEQEWYANHHAGQWGPDIRNVSDDHEWQLKFAGKHAEAPRHASDCHSLSALREWRDAQRAQIEAFVPRTFREIAEDDVDHEYESNEARIVAEEARQHAGNHSANDRSVAAGHGSAVSERAHAQFLFGVPAATGIHMDWYEQWIPHPQHRANATLDWYANHYAGKWAPKIHNVSNGSEWRNNFMRKYAEAYRHYAEQGQRISHDFANATQRARDCHTLAELRGWRDAQHAQIEAFLPLAFQRIALEEVDREFEANEARIAREAEETSQRASNASNAGNASGRTEVQLMEQAVAPQNPMALYVQQWIPSPPQASRNASGRHYMDQYAQHWIPHPLPASHTPPDWYIHHNAGQQWRDSFMDRYAEAYNHYAADFAQLVAEHPRSPPHASDCHSEEELNAWRRLQSAQITAFVPKTFQALAEDSLTRACQAQRARLAAEGLSVVGYGAPLHLAAMTPSAVLPVVLALVLLLVAAAISGRWVRSRRAEEEIADYYVQV